MFHFSLKQIFHDVAYKAKDRSDLLAGIDEFLDQVTVLPPGEWDPSIRIEPPKSVPSQADLNTSSLSQRVFFFFFCSILNFVCNMQEKRKMPGVPNGTACPVEEELQAEHHGPELQRTGK